MIGGVKIGKCLGTVTSVYFLLPPVTSLIFTQNLLCKDFL